MVERRSLTDNLHATPSVPREVAQEFIFGQEKAAKPIPAVATAPRAASATIHRSPISVRIRADFADALKRASLERQLNKQAPYLLQEIFEEAIEPWLRSNGYIE